MVVAFKTAHKYCFSRRTPAKVSGNLNFCDHGCFNPFDSNLISASDKTFLERFFINFSSPSFKEEVCVKDFFLPSLRFLVLVCPFVMCVLPLVSFSRPR